MTEHNTGGPAFPRPASEAHQHGMHDPQKGMTLRDYFAGKALQGLLASTRTNSSGVLAKDAYNMADAMLEARK